jgi:hypothetical protein
VLSDVALVSFGRPTLWTLLVIAAAAAIAAAARRHRPKKRSHHSHTQVASLPLIPSPGRARGLAVREHPGQGAGTISQGAAATRPEGRRDEVPAWLASVIVAAVPGRVEMLSLTLVVGLLGVAARQRRRRQRSG